MTTCTLYLLSMPLNGKFNIFGDETLDIIKQSSVIIGEDRKNILRMLAFLNQRDKDYLIINEHTSFDEKTEILHSLLNRDSAVFFSDAGTPCVADPGYDFIDMCHNYSIKVLSLSSSSSITTALSLSGFFSEKFYFAGFPPKEKFHRKRFFSNIVKIKDAIVLMERPYSLQRVIEELKASGCNRRISVSFNIGFHNENTVRGDIFYISEISKQMSKQPFVIVLDRIER